MAHYINAIELHKRRKSVKPVQYSSKSVEFKDCGLL